MNHSGGDVDGGEGEVCVCVWAGYEKPLNLSLNFVVNLKFI
jgi:hypothetical protein